MSKYFKTDLPVDRVVGYSQYNAPYVLQEVKLEDELKPWETPKAQYTDFDSYLKQNNPKLHKELTEMKKFYVGSTNVSDSWKHSTLQAAINHAKERCEETDEIQYVVQIVRIVKPAKRPIIVEKV